MAEENTTPLLGGDDAMESGIKDSDGTASVQPSRSSSTGRAPFKYHRVLSGKAFNDSSNLSEGQREYNRVQRETLSLYREVAEGPVGGAHKERDEEEPYESLAINLSNIANVVLLVLKVFISNLMKCRAWLTEVQTQLPFLLSIETCCFVA